MYALHATGNVNLNYAAEFPNYAWEILCGLNKSKRDFVHFSDVEMYIQTFSLKSAVLDSFNATCQLYPIVVAKLVSVSNSELVQVTSCYSIESK